jgi:tetratricopeptide (TPR) repeat protein
VSLFLILATVLVYGQIGQHGFIDWDDPLYVTDNDPVKAGLTFKSISWAFTSLHATNWHPLTWLSHMMDVQLFGLDAGWHHRVNLLFHILNTLLLFAVLKRVTGVVWQSGFVAALFALHPLHVESVAWVAERKDVLSTFFWMLTMYFYLLYSEHREIKRYLLVFFCFALGLMAKPMLVTLPFVLLLFDYWPIKNFQFSGEGQGRLFIIRVIEKIPLLALTVASCIITFTAQDKGGALSSLSDASMDSHAATYYVDLMERVSNALVSYVSYLGKTVYPVDLLFFYPFRESVPGWQVAGSLFLLVAISIIVLWRIRQQPYLAVGWFWYLGTLVPVIGFIQVGLQGMADRYSYVPLIGIFIMLAWGVTELTQRWRRRDLMLASTGMLLLVLCMLLSWKQVGYWKSSIALYQHTADVSENNRRAHFKLGTALVDEGRLEEALVPLTKAVHIQPYDLKARFNLGVVYFKLNRFDEAVKHFDETVKIFPSYEPAQKKLNMARAMRERMVVPADTNQAYSYMQSGLVLEREGKLEAAIGEYRKQLELKPDDVRIYQRLGMIYYRLRQFSEAVRHYTEVVRINPGLAEGHYNLGLALVEQGLIDKAVEHYRHALQIKPDFAEVHNNLGVALFRMGKTGEAEMHLRMALQFKPNYPYAKRNLEHVLASRQQVDK